MSANVNLPAGLKLVNDKPGHYCIAPTTSMPVCETSEDEDAVADAGNDLVELRLLLKRVREEAVARFGKGVLELGREPL